MYGWQKPSTPDVSLTIKTGIGIKDRLEQEVEVMLFLNKIRAHPNLWVNIEDTCGKDSDIYL